MEAIITAKEALEMHYSKDEKYIPKFNEQVRNNPKGFDVMDDNSLVLDTYFNWVREKYLSGQLREWGYEIKHVPSSFTNQAQWNWERFEISYGERS